MKKLVLIDDNTDGNRSKYGGGFIDEKKYSNVILSITQISEEDDLYFLHTASCIMLHDTLQEFYNGTFHDESHIVSAKIRDMFAGGDTLPFVRFSDGFSGSDGDYNPAYPNYIPQLNKRLFYSRLEDLVKKYVKTGTVDLRILAYGLHYERTLAGKAATAIFRRLQDYRDGEMLPIQKLLGDNSPMKQIVEMASPNIGKSYDEIIDSLQWNNITVGELKKRINTIVENIQEYGKNSYTWE